MSLRIGNGFDVHSLVEGSSIILCGITIPHNKTLVGHSDADVAMHALTDSIFGALCEGDIGQHFPPSSVKWKDADSSIFLKKAIAVMRKRKYEICNIDLTIICETPKISEYSILMRTSIATHCNIDFNDISIKGTTSEKLGFTGRDEGIATFASVLLKSYE